MTVEVGGIASTVRMGTHIKVSLRTRDVAEGRLRHASVQAQLEQHWVAERNGATALTHKQVMALAGIWYREMVADHSDNPGNPDNWHIYQELLADGLAYFDPNGDGIEREPYDPAQGIKVLSRYGVNVDAFLQARGLNVDEPSRVKLIEQVAWALALAARTLIRRASGDYGPDRTAEQFPSWEFNRLNAMGAASGPRLVELFDGWAKESQPKPSTVDQWRSCLTGFIQYLGHDVARDVRRSDVIGWKQHLVDLQNSPKTINGSKLAALKAIYKWGVDNDLVPANPAAGVSVRQKEKVGQRMLGFEKHQATLILRAAAQQSSPVYRWVSLLCAQSGARVSEICQLRAEDIQCEDGITFMDFRAEAGSLKNPSSERKVPLHPYVVEAGFLDFVRRKKKGPLFYDPARRRPGAKKPAPKIVAKNVARWVHTLGIEGIGRRLRKDPNHAWRHLFQSLARDVDIPESVALAVTGYKASSVGQSYGEAWLSTCARAINRIPLQAIISALPPSDDTSNADGGSKHIAEA